MRRRMADEAANVSKDALGESASVCVSCGAARNGKFCSQCGEKVVEPRDFSVVTFLKEAAHALTSTESNMLRSFLALLTRPGQMTADYLAGKRVGYLKPLQLFLICNVFFFFAQPYITINTFTTPLSVHLNRVPYSPLATRMVTAEVARRNVTLEDYQIKFNKVINDHARSIIICMVPQLAVVLQLLYWRRERYYGEHLIFTLHFFAFLLVALPFLIGVLYKFGIHVERAADLTLLLFFGTYLYIAQRRVFPQSLGMAVLRTLGLLGGLLLVLQLYRLTLFFVTFYSI